MRVDGSGAWGGAHKDAGRSPPEASLGATRSQPGGCTEFDSSTKHELGLHTKLPDHPEFARCLPEI